jgi:hypothetical protein
MGKGFGDMHSIGGLAKLGAIAKIIMFDLIAGLFLAWLVIDNPRRVPFLFLAIPALVCASFAMAWWRLGLRNRASISLPAVYLVGLACGVVWTVVDFKWWKLPLLVVPLAFFIIHVQRFRRNLAWDAKR